jgi:nicotinamidase-related amidase
MCQALLIVDMVNPFDFPGGKPLLRAARPVAQAIARLRDRFHRARAPVVYVNDNFLDWKGGFDDLLAHCGREGMPGAGIVALLAPGADDRFVLKPRHSGFLDSPLELLLRQLRVGRVVVCGLAADSCILITAHDAHMRGFQVHVPRDCVAAQTAARRERALALMRDAFGFCVHASRTVRLPRD